MSKNKKISKKEIKTMMKNISRQIYIDDITRYEKFKQVQHKGIYYPYIISSFGRVFSIYYGLTIHSKIKLKELSLTKTSQGYYTVGITDDNNSHTVKVHILVAEAFIKNDKPLTNIVVNHKDGDKSHNYEWNLEWCTHRENTIHAYKMGLCKQLKGEESKRNIYSEKLIRKVCKLLEKNISIKDISKKSSVSKRTIQHILLHETWTNISSEYDFSNYNFGKPHDYIERIKKVCKLLETNKYTMYEISEKTGITYAMVKNILNGKAYEYISKNYKISNFNNYQNNLHNSKKLEK